jgi:hypothetical protein
MMIFITCILCQESVKDDEMDKACSINRGEKGCI